MPSADAWHSVKGPSPWPGRHGGFPLPSAVVALGKSSTECPTCGTRQRSLCREGICRQLFAECSTRQRLCRVKSLLCRVQLHSAKHASAVVIVFLHWGAHVFLDHSIVSGLILSFVCLFKLPYWTCSILLLYLILKDNLNSNFHSFLPKKIFNYFDRNEKPFSYVYF